MPERTYVHRIAIVTTPRCSWNYFREMLQVANVDPATRKSVREALVSVSDLRTVYSLGHVTYFRDDDGVLEWITWLVRNGFDYSYAFNGDGFKTKGADDDRT